jgi:hypothetical protein
MRDTPSIVIHDEGNNKNFVNSGAATDLITNRFVRFTHEANFSGYEAYYQLRYRANAEI